MSVIAVAVGAIIAISGAEQPAAADTELQQKTNSAARGGARAAPLRALVAPAAESGAASTASPKASASTARRPQPVAGLNQTQMNNAAVIVQAGRERDLPRRAVLAAMMTALQESSLRNLANPSVPASFDEPNEGSSENFDSLGLFQQRPSQGWGTVPQLMDPRYAADAFYRRLLRVPDWESKTLGAAAQAVQRSALPDAYDKHEKQAIKILEALR